ncbi:DDE-type integrase/transposase/recombinase [Chryseobacterium daecheongense]|nr:DDE-type integrase/transposase/recombinase [Chryseobacterium daecheongense]
MNRTYISKGEKVIYDNKECIIIKIISTSKVSISEIHSNIIHTVSLKDITPFADSSCIPMEILTDKDWEKAKARFNIIKPILSNRGDLSLINRIAFENNVSVPTIYRWLKFYDNGQTVASLAGKRKTGGQGKSRLTNKQEEIISDKINSVYLNQNRRSITKVIREVKIACHDLGIPSPHDNTIRSRIKGISDEEKIKKRLGIKEARYKYEPIKSNYEEATFPLSIVQIDHTLLDIILVDELERKAYKRPWITVAIDIYSRMVIGLYLSYDPPGAIGTGMCISNSILPKELWLERIGVSANWPCWGVMDSLHLDNAKEFHGKMLRDACDNYGISLKYRPIATPHYGGHIERLLGTFASEIHNLPGTTFSNEQERKNYKSEENSSLTLSELERWLITYITKIYHTRTHSSLGISPLKKYEDGIMGNENIPGRGILPRINDIRRTRLDFMPYVVRSIQEYGVVIDHLYYYADVLRPYIHKKDNNKGYIFKRDPRDISLIYFLDPVTEEYFDIPFRNATYPAISLWEYRDSLKKVKERNKEITEENIFEAFKELTNIENKSVLKTKRQRREPKSFDYRNENNTSKIDLNNFIPEDNEIIKPFEDLDDETFNKKY